MSASTLVLLGAARSGTKLLRDLVASHDAVSCVPHDVNFLWTSRNRALGHDELTAADASADVAHRIRRRLERHRRGSRWLVDKTVSNTLRVPFVDAVLPEARYLHLVRDGRDVALSSIEQWRAPTDWRRLLSKLRLVPPSELASYGLRYLRARSRDDEAATSWGVRPAQLDRWVRDRSLLEVNALQWVASVEAAIEGLAPIPPGRQLTIRYEELVAQPLDTLTEVLAFMGLAPDESVRSAVTTVSADHVGSRLATASPGDIVEIETVAGPTLEKLGYPVTPTDGSPA